MKWKLFRFFFFNRWNNLGFFLSPFCFFFFFLRFNEYEYIEIIVSRRREDLFIIISLKIDPMIPRTIFWHPFNSYNGDDDVNSGVIYFSRTTTGLESGRSILFPYREGLRARRGNAWLGSSHSVSRNATFVALSNVGINFTINRVSKYGFRCARKLRVIQRVIKRWAPCRILIG